MISLRYPETATEDHLRQAVVETGRIAYERGLLSSSDGNISVRLPDGNILITPTGIGKGRMLPEDLLVVSLSGELVKPAADPSLKVTSEQPMHLEVFQRRPEIRAVLHAHPPYAVTLTVAGRAIRCDVLPEAAIALGEVPISDFAVPSSPDNARAIRELIIEHDVLMLRNHGSLTVGRHLEEALNQLERLEAVSYVQILSELLGEVNPLPAAILPELAAMRARIFGKQAQY